MYFWFFIVNFFINFDSGAGENASDWVPGQRYIFKSSLCIHSWRETLTLVLHMQKLLPLKAL